VTWRGPEFKHVVLDEAPYFAVAGKLDGPLDWVPLGQILVTSSVKVGSDGKIHGRRLLGAAEQRSERLSEKSFSFTMPDVDPMLVTLMTGYWFARGEGRAKDELLWRLNQHWHGRDPGKPVNWKGIE
jgi:hypothetical protein